jgi:hypothetical protein
MLAGDHLVAKYQRRQRPPELGTPPQTARASRWAVAWFTFDAGKNRKNLLTAWLPLLLG